MIRRFLTAVSLIAAGAASLRLYGPSRRAPIRKARSAYRASSRSTPRPARCYGAFTKYEKEARFLGRRRSC